MKANHQLKSTPCDSGDTSVETIDFPIENWEIKKGELRNIKTDFFSVAEFIDDEQQSQLLIKQSEPALVGLLMTEVDGQKFFALCCRSEPGLHNLAQMTTTVQSTPSNYLQRHGGGKTSYIEYFIDFESIDTARIKHYSRQFDWGEYYLFKTKIFMIIEIDSRIDLERNFLWISENELRRLVKSNFSITSDLRAISQIALGLDQSIMDTADTEIDILYSNEVQEFSGLTQVPLDLSKWIDSPIDSGLNRKIKFVRTHSISREVSLWDQPLIKIDAPKVIKLYFYIENSKKIFAVCTSTQIGLNKKELLFPADFYEGSIRSQLICRTENSAEGGRFYQHLVVAELHQLDSFVEKEGVNWMTFDELQSLCKQSLKTSLELRMALSLIESEVQIENI